MARAVVLHDGSKKVAIVSLDLVGLFHANVEHVRKGLPGFDYVLVTSTHNHEGPDTMGILGADAVAERRRSEVHRLRRETGVAAVKAADAALKPATAHIGAVKAPELLHDSREPYVKHDDLVVLAFRDGDTLSRPRRTVELPSGDARQQ